jgi:3',5'-cyclic AMP phosphodiesterase CpdA
MLIAQITDIHLGFDQGNPDEHNRRRLDTTLMRLASMEPRPDMLIASGDLADAGDDEVSYGQLKQALSGMPFPVYFALGNHDSRAAFRAAFPDVPVIDGGFVQYEIDAGPLRLLVLDTLEEGRHGGGFCETRAAWLRERLAETPDRPTVIVLHHPPIQTGLPWMTENPDAQWIKRLHAIVAAHGQIVAMIAGHLHRPVVTAWAGTVLAVCPSTAPQVALDLGSIDPDRPDQRPMIVADPPWFGLHLWTGEGLVSHFDTADEHEVLARYGPNMQPLVRMLIAEKAQV